jgi:hypothetical protein
LADFDLVGALTSTGALFLLVAAVVEAPLLGWTSPVVLGMFGASLLLAWTFLATERRHRAPLVRLGILRSWPIAHANVVGAVLSGAYTSFQFLVTLYLQQALGWSPIAMALGFLPGGLLVIASATRMDRVLERVPTQVLIALGMTSFLAAYLLFLRVDPALGYAALLLPTMLLLGTGFALSFPSMNAQATSGVVDEEQGLASGLVNTSVQVGGAIILAVVSAVLGAAARTEGPAQPGRLIPGMVEGLHLVVAITAVGVVASAASLLWAWRRRPAQPPVECSTCSA